MKLKYSDIKNENGIKSATMYIFGIIGYDVIGEEFARELKYLHEQQQITNLDVLINSAGGSVISGYSIISALKHAETNGVSISMKNVGVAYSMGGIILVTAQKRTSFDYGTVMIHDPRFNKDEENSDSENAIVLKIADSLAIIIANNTGRDLKEVKDLMSKETVFSSAEALDFSFIDSIEKTGRTINLENKTDFDKMVALGTMYKNNSNFINKNSVKMEKIALILGLNAEASEEAIVNELNNLLAKKDVSEVTKQNATLTKKVSELENSLKDIQASEKKTKAEALINNAEAKGLISKENKADWLENASLNFEGTEKLLKSMKPTKTEGINNLLDGGTPTEGEAKTKELAAKYEKMLIETPVLLDAVPEKELIAMEEAFEKVTNYAIEK